jgi:hypothetical protein
MRYNRFLEALCGVPFPAEQDYPLEDEEGFRLAVLTALVKAVHNIRTSGPPTAGPLQGYQITLWTAVQNSEDVLRAKIAELEGEITSLKVNMAERKVIERAKGFLMQLGIPESEAHKRLRAMASAKNMKLAVVAAKVVELTELFQKKD